MTHTVLMKELQAALSRCFRFETSFRSKRNASVEINGETFTEKKIRSKGGEPFESAGSKAGGFVVRNVSMTRLVGLLTFNIPNEEKLPFINCTGIDGQVDFSIERDMTDVKDLQRGLDPYGLSLVKSTAPMKVLSDHRCERWPLVIVKGGFFHPSTFKNSKVKGQPFYFGG